MKFKIGDTVRIVIDDPKLHDNCPFLDQIRYGTIIRKDNDGFVCVRLELTIGFTVPWWLDTRCLGLCEESKQDRFEFHKKRVESRHLGV